MKGVLRDHLGIPVTALGREVFPGSDAIAPIADLLI
jgi:uncharacterized protein (DUF1501 family)